MFSQFLSFMNQKTFFQKVQLCHTQPHIGFLATCQNLIKHMTKKKKGKGGHTIFYKTLPATTEGPMLHHTIQTSLNF